MKYISKTFILCATLLILCGLNTVQSFAQAHPVSKNYLFDTVADTYGNRIPIENITIGTAKFGTANVISSITETCQAGYFTLYFESSSIFGSSASARTVACQVFSDISNFITSNAPAGSVKIHCGSPQGLGLAEAGTYVVFPNFLSNQNQGIIDGQVYKALVTGTNPYLSVPLSLNNASQIYHGFVNAATTGTSNPWTYNLTTTVIASNEYDMYSNLLHEVTHSMGFLSMMRFDGLSIFTPTILNTPLYSYYSRYDMFLRDNNNNPLLVAPIASCAISGLTFAPSSYSVLGAGMAVCPSSLFPQDITNCSNAIKYIGSTTATVYTPYFYETGSSLSHFEDMCSGNYTGTCTPIPNSPGSNNLYYVMSNFVSPGSCYVKRHLTSEERLVLCDLGYTVGPAYGGTAVAGSSYTYSGGTCSPTNIIGNNDGYYNGIYSFLVTSGSSTSIPYSTLLANDSPSTGLSVSCVELVTNNATFTNGTTDFSVTVNPGGGLVVLKYIPRNSSGQIGNATFVFINFVPPGCLSCGIINNGGFESATATSTASSCGDINNLSNARSIDCWYTYGTNYKSNILTTSCTSFPLQLGVNTVYTSPPIGTLSLGANTNTNAVGLEYNVNGAKGSIVNTLNTPLVNTQTYQISFWVINYSSSTSTANLNGPANPVVLSLASSTSIINPYGLQTSGFPNGLNPLVDFTISASNTWAQITGTFAYSPSIAAQQIVLGINTNLTADPATFNPSYGFYFCFIDEVSIIPIPGPNFSIPNNTICTSGSMANLSLYTGTTSGVFSGPGVSFSGTQYDFNLTSTLTPGVYPIAFTYTNPPTNCLNTIYQSVNVMNCCATSTAPSFTGTTISGSSVVFNSAKKFPNSFTVQPGTQFVLAGAEFLIDPGVKITVSSTATLMILGSHLYGCTGLWQGIEVLDGGVVKTVSYGGNENLIEDAEIAIDITNYNPATTNGFIELKDIIFNKNYISVNLANYTLTSSSYSAPVSFNNCVFTCRNFTFNSTSWPKANTSDLRSASNATTGLAPPYSLQNAPITTLKAPHAGEPSHIGINLLNSGTTQTLYPASSIFSFNNVYIGPASVGTPSANFILFDAHEISISGSGSNAQIENCVFQNTQTLTANAMGAAIQFTSGVINNRMYVTGTTANLSCRFYDCHTAINIKDMYSVIIENSIIRSTHNISVPSSSNTSLPGDRGIYINTNRFEDYIIRNNELTNVTDAIAMVCAPGNFVGGAGWFEPYYYGGNWYYWNIVYARDVVISGNTISPQSSTTFTGTTNNYVYNAITVTGPLNIWSTWGVTDGISIKQNKVYRAYNGINLNGLNSIGIGYHADGPPKLIQTNTITLEDVSTATVTQIGIDYSNSMPAPSGFPTFSNQTLQSVETNSINVYNAPITNTNVMLLHAAGNGAAGSVVPSPYIICNSLSDAYQGFVFEGDDRPTYWRGNDMTNLAQGMCLVNSATIGAQGTPTSSSDNTWLGSWSSYTNTYVDGSSDAASSKLFVQSGSSTNPSNNTGPFPGQTYGSGTNITVVTPGASTYVCGAGYNQLIVPIPIGDPTADVYTFMECHKAYRNFYYHQDLLGLPGSEPRIFLDTYSGSSIGIFTLIEDTLSRGNLIDAQSLLSSLDPDDFTNVAETNLFTFFELYIKFKNGIVYSPMDEDALAELVALCPGTNGMAVYQARALYLMLKGKVFNAPYPCNERGSSRVAPAEQKSNGIRTLWDVDIFPNPASNLLNIINKTENELLDVKINDPSGRTLMRRQIKSSGFIANLDLALLNGVYFINISNQKNESVTKKLLIVK